MERSYKAAGLRAIGYPSPHVALEAVRLLDEAPPITEGRGVTAT
jgi:hypothetical protein